MKLEWNLGDLFSNNEQFYNEINKVNKLLSEINFDNEINNDVDLLDILIIILFF